MTAAQRRRFTLLVMCVATFMIQLDVTVVNVALPRIQADLGMSRGRAGVGHQRLRAQPGGAHPGRWGAGRPLRPQAGVPGRAGHLRARVGRLRRCPPAPTALIASRAVQGLGGAAMLALTLSILTETFPAAGPGRRHRHLGRRRRHRLRGRAGRRRGILLTFFGWASVFWVNVPFAVAGIDRHRGRWCASRATRDPAAWTGPACC